MKVHIIDPDLRFRRLLLAALEPYPVACLQSTSLREADLELPVSHPDLIVMDGIQPDGEGVEWLRQKRKSGLKTPVFFFSSSCHSTEHFCELVNELGVKVVLHKPVTAAALNSLFGEYFTSKKEQPKATPTDLDEIEREIKALSIEYIRELPDRFAVLTRQVADLKMGRGEPSTAKNEAHKIKGTASSYGVHDIGEQAVIIDDCLKKVCNETQVNADLWARLEEALKEALRLAEKAVAEVDDQPSAAPAVYDERTAMSNVGLSTTKGQSIVIVDDDADFTRRVALILGYEDMNVYSFNDARKIIDVLAHLKPDLLILDLNMPDMDGFEVCKKIRIDGRFRKLPIVFLTAQTGWETRVAAFDAGADDYIPKPVVNQELIARIRVRAEKSRLQEEVSRETSVNKLLWQAMYLLLMQQKVAK